MINYQVKYSHEFKKSIKKIIKQGKNIDKLFMVIENLAKGVKLNLVYRDHALRDNKQFRGCRDCHIEPDWILIYKYIDKEIVLLLINTGSHSELLDK